MPNPNLPRNTQKPIYFYTGEDDTDGIHFYIEDPAKPFPVISLTNDGILAGDGTAEPTREGVGAPPRIEMNTCFEVLERFYKEETGGATVVATQGSGFRIQGGATGDVGQLYDGPGRPSPTFFDSHPQAWFNFWLENGYEADCTWNIYIGLGHFSEKFAGLHIRNNNGVAQLFTLTKDGTTYADTPITTFDATVFTRFFIRQTDAGIEYYINGTLMNLETNSVPSGALTSGTFGVSVIGQSGTGNPEIYVPLFGYSLDAIH